MRLRIVPTVLGAALLALPAAAPAQESNTIGPPALSEFELRPENRMGPTPEAGPTIAPLNRQPPAQQRQAPAPRPEPVVTIPAPTAPSPAREAAPIERRAEARPSPQPGATVPGATPPPATDDSAPAPGFADFAPEPAPEPATAMPEPSLAPPENQGPGNWWLYLLFGAALAALGFVVLRRKGGAEPALAAPAPHPAPVPPPAAEPEQRPWLEVEFKPEQAGANEEQAAVKFELMLRNVGEVPARNVRIHARMFNAGSQHDQEITAFFARPGGIGSTAAPVPMPPQSQIPFRSVVILPRDQVREVSVEGRRLFIPVVAFNIVYGWGERGRGQISASYLVGVEGKAPSEKMGAFRLDLGPRIYRTVGQRPHRLERRA
ncbi:hypothetical protein ACFQRC_09280 [Enterovirga sp. GCM10030262]|uniref:hypothetical protein n=1 Tax=Enterovirga sp. GCM10030262 TaxID=3273391 RepID=UPI003618831E